MCRTESWIQISVNSNVWFMINFVVCDSSWSISKYILINFKKREIYIYIFWSLVMHNAATGCQSGEQADPRQPLCPFVRMQCCHPVYTTLGTMTLTGLQSPYLAICLSLCHRFPLKLNDELELTANRHTPNYCKSLACRTHRPTEHRQTQTTDRGGGKKPCITRATNPLIRT